MPTGTVITSVKDVLAAALGIVESAQKEVVWIIPASINTLSLTYGGVDKIKAFIQKGGLSRGAVQISPANITEIQMFLDTGEDIRHSDEVHEVFMFVGDKQQSISSLNIGVKEFTLDTPVTAFWSESLTYAEYLLTSFENVWSEAIPAEERIQELLEQGPAQV
ncbi:MAG: hypothetical protein ACXW02_07150 [Halobacteriota archaeon]